MRKLYLAIALAISVPLAGCQTFPNISSPVLAGTTKDEKAVFVAEAAFQGASLALEQAINTGLVNQGNAAQAQLYYRGAYGALKEMRKAQQTGDSGTLLEMSVLVQQYAAQIFTLIK